MIVCGWCQKPTPDWDHCRACGHENPRKPWFHRGLEVPVLAETTGRPSLDEKDIRQRLRDARSALGERATLAALAAHLDVSETTVRRWRKVAG